MGRLLCVGVPAGTSVGLDMHAWTVGPSFGGFGDVHHGTHLLHVAANANAPRASVFFFQPPGDGSVVVARWNTEEEALAVVLESADGGRTTTRGGVPDDDDAARRAAAAVTGGFDAQLGPADHERDAEWAAATSFVQPDVFDRFQPVRRVVRAVVASTSASAAEVGAGAAGSAGSLAPADDQMGMATVHSLFFLPVRGVGTAAAPADVTAYAVDTTSALFHAVGALVRRHGVKPGAALACHLLGELQAAFLLAWLGESLPGLEQWKRLVDVLMRAEDAMGATSATFPDPPLASSSHDGCGVDPDTPAIVPGDATSGTWVPTPGFWSAAYGAIALQLDRLPEEALQWGSDDEGLPAASTDAAGSGAGAGATDAPAAGGVVAPSAPGTVRSRRSNATFLRRSFQGLASIVARSDGAVLPQTGSGRLHPTLTNVAKALLLHAGSRFVPEWNGVPPVGDPGLTAPHAAGHWEAAALASHVAGAGAGAEEAGGGAVSAGAGGSGDISDGAGVGISQREREALMARLLLEGGDDDLPAIVE